MTGKPVNDWTAWISQAEQLGDFIEGLASSIVARLPNVFIRPTVSSRLGPVEMGMSAGNN